MFRIQVIAAVLAATAVACQGPQGEPGPEGPRGPGGEASISAVLPNSIYLGRTEDVVVVGYSTEWQSAPTVDFGAGVTVNNVTVASPTSLLVNITVAPTAAEGARDVKVTAGGKTVNYAGGFTIESAVDVLVSGQGAQGSVFIVQLSNRDLGTPFDTTSTGDGFFTPIEYTNVSVEETEGVYVSVQDVSMYSVVLQVLVDVTATPGDKFLTLLSGADGRQDYFPFKLPIAARQPVALQIGDDNTGTLAEPGDTVLYSYTATAGSARFLQFLAAADEGETSPAFALLPASGKFSEMISFSDTALLAADGGSKYYLIFMDGRGGGDYSYSIGVRDDEASAPVEESADHAKIELAQVIAAPISVNATLATEDDMDWYKITVPAGKALNLATMGSARTDTVLEVYELGDTDPVFESGDDDYQERLYVPAPEADTDYYVLVRAGSDWRPAYTDYKLIAALF